MRFLSLTGNLWKKVIRLIYISLCSMSVNDFITAKLLFVLSLVSLFQSCDMQIEMDHHEIPLQFNVGVSAVVESKASADPAKVGFGQGEYNIGMFIGTGEGEEFIPQTDGYDNLRARYVVTAKDNTSYNHSWQFYLYGGQYYPISVHRSRDVGIIAYYPWDEDIKDLTSIPFVSSDAHDWMVSDKKEYTKAYLTELKEESLTVPLHFSHLMTCIEVAITSKRVSNVYQTHLILNDAESSLVLKGEINAYTGEIKSDEYGSVIETSYKSNQVLSPNTTQYFQLIFPAVEIQKDGQFSLSFKFDGELANTEFVLPLEFDGGKITKFEKGTKYRYRLILDNIITFEGLSVEDDWDTASSYIENMEL